jgi:hypothetical protein
MYVEAAWMFATVAYLLVSHIRRIKASHRLDCSVHGDLSHVISLASYQIRLSQLINCNLLPMGAIMILSVWEAGKLFKVGLVLVISYALAFFVGSKGVRKNKRENLSYTN